MKAKKKTIKAKSLKHDPSNPVDSAKVFRGARADQYESIRVKMGSPQFDKWVSLLQEESGLEEGQARSAILHAAIQSAGGDWKSAAKTTGR